MGSWGYAPWECDMGADWFGDLFQRTKLADRVEKTLKKKDVEEYYEEIRAAAHILVVLGRNYIWPVDQLEGHLQLAIRQLRKIQDLEEIQENPAFVDAIAEEIATLESRLTPPAAT